MSRTIRILGLVAGLAAIAVAAPAATFVYGKHYPNGVAAVDYAYGSAGMWRSIASITYQRNYYNYGLPAPHNTDINWIINYAQTLGNQHTCLDANGHLLLDFNKDGEIDVTSGGSAFHEHAGRGVGGAVKTNPIFQFWFDDNWLARHMAVAYSRPQPYGLHAYSSFTRWQIIDGNTANWTPYGGSALDQRALDGLYYLSSNTVSQAWNKWVAAKNGAGPVWNGADQRFDYNIAENYHLGLLKVLNDQLMDASVTTAQRAELVQHSMSLRSHLLSRHEINNGAATGWITDVNNSNSLINIETISCAVLGLGAGAVSVYEAGRAPLSSSSGRSYFLRPHNVLSGVAGISTAGFMTYGPYHPLPTTGTHKADFFLRAPAPAAVMGYIDVYNATTNTVLASKVLEAADFPASTQWGRVTLTFSNTSTSHNIEYRTYWDGTANMDVACIRVRK